MHLPFQTCWDRVDRAEVHRQALIGIWKSLDTQNVYASEAKVDDDGSGKFFFRTIERDWLLPFSLQMGEMLYQLRSGLESCVYDAAILEFDQNPPPDEKRWTFPIAETSEKFNDAARGMKKLPDNLRRLLEAVQPYAGATCGAKEIKMRWDLGQVLNILNLWAVIDRHRRLNLVGTAITTGRVKFNLPEGAGMSVESWDFEMGKHLLEHDTEIARFKIRNFVPGTQVNVDAQFSVEILVNEVPGMAKLQDAALTMGMSVSAVRESFERHYGIERK
jgi:hypothetical protein